MAAAAVDVGYLAASYAIPDTTIESLLSAPTIELVQSLLTQIEQKAHSYDDLQSEKIRADVELEAAVQAGEQRARTLKTAADAARKEAGELQQKLTQEEHARQRAESDLQTFQATATTSTSQVQALESRIKTLESQNRDAIAMHEAKVAAHDRLAAELSEQHQKSVDLRKQLSALEETNQALENVATNVKFRETNLQQEIEQLRKNNDWYTTELKTRSDDHSKYRKEKNAQIAQLQRENADASETADSLRRTETLLRQHVQEVKTKAEEDRALIEQLENSASKVESDFRIELDSARRLASLHQQNAESAKKRLQELQAEAEKIQDDAAAEIGQLQADVELERSRAVETEARIAELETLVENLQHEATELKTHHIPATPRRGMNGSTYGTPGRAGSPAVFSPGGSHMKGGPSNTQILKENIDLKSEIRKLRQKIEEQTTMVNDMLEELERRQPEFEDLRRQNDALTAQSTELSAFLDEAITEREAARREARKAIGDLEGVQNESAHLRHEIQDMTIQLRSLVWRREADQNGLDSLPTEQKQFILDAVDNQVPDNLLPNDSATQNMITKHLVLYKNITDLQYQNAELLRTIRKVGEEHEAQEARNNAEQHKKDLEELSQLRTSVAERDEQIKSLNLRSQTFKTERDMYYRIVISRGHAQPDNTTTSAFAQSVPATGAALQLGQSQSRPIPEYDNLIKDLQAHINLLKEESATDRATSRTQVDSLTKENSHLQSERVRFESQVRREQDRYNRLESTIKLLQAEKDTLQERYDSAQTNYAKRDDRAVKAEQDLADATSRIQRLDNEMVNLKASQNMSKTIEARLNERVKELTDERDRLSKMVSEIQSLRNEQELTNADNRRRLQASHDKLEADLQIARRKLEDEVADHKKTAAQRDYERIETQRRIDDLITARNNAEVKSATADTTRQQLEQRIKELQTQLESTEERVQSLQPRPTPRADGTRIEEGEEDEELISREEDLTAQLSDLQRKIERKQEDLEAVNAQIKGFQDIAQDAEDRLQNFMEAHDRLQEELDAAQQEKDATIRDLQQRVEEISSELASTTTELTELRGQHEQENLQLSQQKDALEVEIAQLKNDLIDYKAEADAQSELVKSQAEIATRAQKDYEYELAKHGETMKNLRVLRDEHSQLQTEIAQYTAQAEAARSTLEQSQEHWKSTQDQFDNQLLEAKRRHDDLKQYNETLLKQFDEYKSQIDNLKHDRASVPGTDDAGTTGLGSNNMQDIEVYLRREKEILEVQLNLKEQEVKRLEQQLTHSQNQLDQTREKLLTEQSKSQGSQSGSSLQNLQEKVEQLNLFRESNTTLRSDNGRLQTQLAEKIKALEDLQSELEPLQVRVTELEGELELSTGHLKAVEEDRDRWQKRHQDVLQRYDRIDPKELEDLKRKIEDLNAERDQAVSEVTGLNEKIQILEARQEFIIQETREATIAEVKTAETEKARKGFNRVHNEKMQQKKVEIDGLTAERNELQNQFTNAQQEVEASQQQLMNAQTEANKAKDQLTALQQQLEQAQTQLTTTQGELATARTARTAADVDMSEEGQVTENNTAPDIAQIEKLQTDLEASQRHAAEAEAKAASLSEQVAQLTARVTALDNEVVSMPLARQGNESNHIKTEKANEILDLQNRLHQAQTQPSQSTVDNTTSNPPAVQANSDEIRKLQEEIATARKEAEDLRTQLDIATTAARPAEPETKVESQEDSEQLSAAKAAQNQREIELKNLEAEVNTRLENVQNREAKSKDLLERANSKILKIREDTNKEIDRLKAAHQAEVESLRQEKQTAETDAAPSGGAANEGGQAPMVPVAEDMVNTQTLPRPAVTGMQLKAWINNEPVAKQVISSQIKKHLETKENQMNTTITTLNQEIAILKAEKSVESGGAVKAESGHVQSQGVEEALAKAKAEYETSLKETLDKEKQGWIQRGKDEEGKRFNVKMSMANRKTEVANDKFEAVNVKWLYVQRASQETPTEEVAKVYGQAEQQKPPPKPAAQSNTPAKPQASVLVPQQAPTQSNGTNFGAQPGTQMPNPFAQAAQNVAANHFLQAQNQMGRGLPQPGFASQPQVAQAQPPQQQFGRGRGDGVGTGPAALRGVIQSSIPRGGATGIPMPGGRGRGQQQQQQPNQAQAANSNIPGATGASQIGRGGGRGIGRGRGLAAVNVQGQTPVVQGQVSPRNSLNPGATQFQPGGGIGRGQKRGAEDDTEGGTRGGKRPRGRGGQGGGGAGGAPAASA